MGNPWGDIPSPGGKTKPKGKTGKAKKPLGLTGRVIQRGTREIREIASAVPYIPRVIAEQGARLAGIAGQESAAKDLAKLATKLPTPAGIDNKPIEVGAAAEAKKLSEAFRKGRGEGIAAVADLPGVSLIPGSYAASRALTKEGRTELGERPVSAALDILPYAGKAVKVATKSGQLATEAAKVAEQAGRTAKAERMVTKGLKIPEAAAQLGRRAEKAVISRHPTADALMPSTMLSKAQAGGAELRGFMRTLNIADRRFAAAQAQKVKEIVGIGEDLGITPDRQRVLTELAEKGTPNWRTQATPDEQQWLKQLSAITDEVADVGIAEGKLVRFADDIWSKAGEPAVFKAVKAVERTTAAMERATGPRRLALANKAIELEAAARKLANDKPSARWKEALRPFIEEQVRALSAGSLPDPSKWEEIYGQMYRAGTKTQIPGMDQKTIARIARQASRKLAELKAAGYDPMFVPTLQPQDVAALARPRLTVETIKAPAAFKARGLNQKNLHVPQATIAVAKAAVDLLERSHAIDAFEELKSKGFVVSRSQVESLPQIQALVQKGWDATAVEGYISKRWRAYTPNSPFPFGRAGVMPRSAEEWFLPSPLADALNSMSKGSGGLAGGLGRALEGRVGAVAGKVFRTSVLTLSPMYMLENLISGAVMLMARQSPTSLRYLPKALKLLNEGKVPIEITRGARMGVADEALAAYHAKAGGTLGRLLGEAQQSTRPGVTGALGRFARHPITGLENISSSIDDMYRTAAFLKGSKNGAAVEQGVEAALKVFGDFDSMTPLERAVIRSSVVPFYGWSRFILSYVFSFPFDHPLRAAFLSNVSRQTFEDWPDGLPERLKGYLFFGTPDEEGRKIAVSMSGAVPMLGVANMFTLTGMLSRLGPTPSALFQSAGMTEFGELDLYPELKWDPVSGREVAVRPNTAALLAKGYAPHVESLQMMFANTADMARLRESNPEAFRAQLLNTVGIRPPRRYSAAQEQEKSLRARKRSEARAGREGGGSVATNNPWGG